MNLFNFAETIRLDARSKIPLAHQLQKEIYRAIVEKRFGVGEALPGLKELSTHYSLKLDAVHVIYETLIEKNLVSRKEDAFIVAYKDFSYDFYQDYKTIEEGLKQNGFVPKVTKHPSTLIEGHRMKAIHPGFAAIDGLYESRVDFYGDDEVFAVTYNYTPRFLAPDIDAFLAHHDSLDDLFKEHTDVLNPTYTHHAVILPEDVVAAFDVLKGQAGLMIQIAYTNPAGDLFHLYRGYITNRYTVTMNHLLKPTQGTNLA